MLNVALLGALAAAAATAAVRADAAAGGPQQALACSHPGPPAAGSGGGGGWCAGGVFGAETSLLARSAVLTRSAASPGAEGAARSPRGLQPDGHGTPWAYEQQLRLLAERRVAEARAGKEDDGAEGSYAEVVVQIMRLIDDEIGEDMKELHRVDQARITRHHTYLSKCHEHVGNYTENIEHSIGQLEETNRTLSTCRGQQQVLEAGAQEACKQTHEWLSRELTDFGCVLGESIAPEDLKAHIDCAAEFEGAVDQARVLHSSCADKVEAHRAKVEECDGLEGEYREARAGIVRQVTAQCGEYDACYVREDSQYDAAEDEVRQAEKARRHEAVAIERIRCYANKILAASYADLASQGEERMAGCQDLKAENASSLFVVDYPTRPQLDGCPWSSWLNVTETTSTTSVAPPLEPVATTTPKTTEVATTPAKTTEVATTPAPATTTPLRRAMFSLDFEGSGSELADGDASELKYTVIGPASVTDAKSKTGSTSLHCSGGGVGLEGLAFGSGDFIVELWAMLESQGTVHDALFTTANVGNGARFDPANIGVAIALDHSWVGTGSSSCLLKHPLGLTPMQWHHVRAQRIGGNFGLYRDGTLLGETECTATLGHARAEVCNRYVGREDGWRFQGWIDSLNISVPLQ